MNFERVGLLLKQVRFIQFGLLFLMLNAALLFFLVLPENQKISRLQQDYANKRTQLIEEQKSMHMMENRLAALKQAKTDLKTIYEQVLSQKKTGVTEIRQELEVLAGSLSVNRANVSYDYTLLPELGLRHFTLSVPVEGTYRDIRKFINGIERSQHFLILDRVNLSAEKVSTSGETLTLNFELSTYLTDEEVKKEKDETRKRLSRP